MFSMPLIEVSLIELLKLWGELVEAYHGVNGFGGSVAEIYAYRFQRYSPLAHGPPINRRPSDELRDIHLRAGNALVELIEEFCNQYNCQATVDGLEVSAWCRQLNAGAFEFDHRAHVAVAKAAAAEARGQR